MTAEHAPGPAGLVDTRASESPLAQGMDAAEWRLSGLSSQFAVTLKMWFQVDCLGPGAEQACCYWM